MMYPQNENRGLAQTLPKAPEGCYWIVDDHYGAPQVTVTLYRNFLSLGVTVVDSTTAQIEEKFYHCAQSLHTAKREHAEHLASQMLGSLL